jgi:hypothetical protein
MRKVALLVAVAFAVAAPSLAFAAKKAPRHHRHHVVKVDNQSPEYLNRDSIKAFHDIFIWPANK